MVAISLYRGNLHRVSDNPRRWPLPPRVISLRQFKFLIHKRTVALSNLAAAAAAAAVAAASFKKEGTSKVEEEGDGGGDDRDNPPQRSARQDVSAFVPQSSNSLPMRNEQTTEHDTLQETTVGAFSSPEKEVHGTMHDEAGRVDGHLEVRNDSDTASNREERKREVEKELHILNEKKHNLVQMLKQILNAEEELKRRSMQSPVIRPSISQKADTSLEMGTAKQVPKLTVEVNFGSDSGGESDAAANHNIHVRQLHQIHNTSPSATSLTRTTFSAFQNNAGLQNNMTSMTAIGHSPTTPSSLMGGAIVSPSRFAPTAHHIQSTNNPPVPLSANYFMASSLSPAASGGSSSNLHGSSSDQLMK